MPEKKTSAVKSNMDKLEETLRKHIEEITEKKGSPYYIRGVGKALELIEKLK